jgi:uncharacterized membrane protein
VSTHELIVTLVAFAIGLVLSLPVTWVAHKWFEYRDMTRVERMMRRMRKDDE